ncbi:hypothetical protein BVH03_07875 [Pseudomonas sp. PA15(2017)]|uniref:hypothetical protein n=1 Tax=Pseudomonas sp. PA15(2017) TaxID=1932111 RepID=UPI00095D6560|nr:hypothetical protein [Pseudomonas sp. PA15(2017)]OLU32124.1 hypothetical protein BVH03_07875 [Pseudomonas sp. PA15(2017)]
MKADRDDAPTYVRPSARKSDMTTWVVASFLGSAFTVGLLYTLSSLYMQGKVDQLENTHKPKPAPVAEITRSVPAEKDWDKIVEDVARRSNAANQDQPRKQQTQQPDKQTEYSTATYVPQTLPNVIPSQRAYSQQAKPQQQSKKQEIVIIGKETRLRDFCPYAEGSIERRNCKAQIGLQHR